MSLLPLTDTDLQAGAPGVRLPLDRAGVQGVVRGLLLPGGVACTATISVTVGVDPDVRGVHMSRFHEAVDAAIQACGMDATQPEPGRVAEPDTDAAPPAGAGLERLAEVLAREAGSRQESTSAQSVIEATIVLPDRAPATGRETREPVGLRAAARVDSESGEARRALRVQVTGMTACPCAQLLVREATATRLMAEGYAAEEVERILSLVPLATHNQRGTTTLELDTRASLDPSVLAGLARSAMSAHTYELLKRDDERTVVERAHANPRFVEDCVRELGRAVLAAPLGLAPEDIVLLRQVNHESIHAHDVHAELRGSVAELAATLGELHTR